MDKRLVRLILSLIVVFPLVASAQTGGPSFDISSSASYGGGKVLLCFQDSQRTVNASQAANLIARGATLGPCTAPGTLVITKTAVNGDGTFKFYSNNDNLNDFSITTQGGTGTITLHLARGSYNIVEYSQRGWKQTSNTCSVVTVTSGATTTCAVANTAQLGSISGTTYNDLTGNGRPNAFQRLLNIRPGVTVYLDANNNGKLDAGETLAVTNALGDYKFSNLPNGTYHVREVVPAGYQLTYPDSGQYVETLSGQNESFDDFANYLPTRPHHWYDRYF